jgi:allantoicase
VARLRVHGEVAADWERLVLSAKTLDLAAVENGGLALAASDEHFGRKENLLMPGRARNMGDGWETRRSRSPGHLDWAVIRLGGPGKLERIEVDTNHFKGNYPDSCRVEGCLAPAAGASVPEGAWTEVLPQTKLKAHKRHFFAKELAATGPFSHLKLLIYPDGGVSRLRVHGKAVLA